MIPADLLEPKIKNRSRLHYLMANLDVAMVDDPTAWALLLDPDGFIAEGTGSNFFLVKDGKLFTPEPRNILRGIRRKYTMQLARKLGIEVIECNLNEYDAINADEAFFTSTAFTLMPCVKVQGCTLGDGRRGPITQKLIDAWCELVGLDFIAQAEQYLAEASDDAYSGVTMYRFGKGKIDEDYHVDCDVVQRENSGRDPRRKGGPHSAGTVVPQHHHGDAGGQAMARSVRASPSDEGPRDRPGDRHLASRAGSAPGDSRAQVDGEQPGQAGRAVAVCRIRNARRQTGAEGPPDGYRLVSRRRITGFCRSGTAMRIGTSTSTTGSR